MLNIIVIDEDDLVREKIAGVLSRQKRVAMVTQMRDFPDVSYVKDKMTNLVLVDLKMAVIKKKRIKELKKICLGLKLFITADGDDEAYMRTAKESGADGIIKKEKIISGLGEILKEISIAGDRRESVEEPGGCILVADDDAFYRRRIKAILDSAALKSKIVDSGQDAIAELVASRDEYSCVVLDVHMGKMGGIETAELIKRQFRNLPVLLTTADETEETEVKAWSAGASCYLKKPFEEKELIEAVTGFAKKA